MSAEIPASEQLDNARPRGAAAPQTTAPDWLFSAVLHLLLVALLFTSKAGPGGGGSGTGQGGGGSSDFPNDGWIEAQLGSEADATGRPDVSVVSLAVSPATDSVRVSRELPAPHPTDADAQPQPAPIQSAVYFHPPQPPSTAPAVPDLVAERTSSEAPGRGEGGHASGTAGMGRGDGDGSPGDGGHGHGGTSLFGIWDSGERFVYLIDRSSSMQHYGKLAAARQELEGSLSRLNEAIEFQVLYYNNKVHPLTIAGSQGLIRASRVNRNRARGEIRLVTADGGTQHRAALQAALRLQPTVIYFLTDAEEPGLPTADVAELARRLRGATRIHCIQFGDTPEETPTADNWLQQLAAATGGQYVHFRTRELRAAEGERPQRR